MFSVKQHRFLPKRIIKLAMKKTILLSIFALLLLASNYAFAQAHKGIEDFKITVPNSNMSIETGAKITIKWMNYSYTSRNVLNLKIDLISGSKVYTIAKNTLNNGHYTSILPLTIIPGEYKIKISSIDGTAYTLSEQFRIITAIPIRILSPQAGSIWNKNKNHIIKWQAAHPQSKVYINLIELEDNGRLYSRLKIADGIANNGSYTWHVPADLNNGRYIIIIRISPIKGAKHSERFSIE